MKLSSIELAGFRGVRQKLSISCPPGFLVICGRNGSGKSTVCDAIEFCLTASIRESAHKEKGETIADYIWWRGTGTASERFVAVTFVDDSGEAWKVTRTPNGLDEGSKATLDRLYRKSGSPENPLGGLCRTSIIRDEEITSLSVDLPEGERYKFVRDALGSVDMSETESRIDKIRSLIESRLSKEEPVYERFRDQVSNLTARLSDARSALASQVESRDAELTLRQMLGLQEADTQTLLEKARQSLTQGRVQIDRLHRLLGNTLELHEKRSEVESGHFMERLQVLSEELSETERKLAEQTAECEKLAETLDAMKREEPVRAERAELLDHGERLSLTAEGRCPLCGSIVSHDDFVAHIAEGRSQINDQASQVVETVNQHNESLKKRDHLIQQRDRLRKDQGNMLAKRKAVEESSVKLLQEAAEAGLASLNIQTVEAENVRQEIETARTKLQKMEQAFGWLDASRATETVQALEADLQQIKQRADESFAAKTKMESAIARCKKATKGIRSLLGELIDERLSELSPLIEELYKRLRPHVEWTSINYRLRGDVRRMLSFEVGDGLNPSFVFSSGQRRAAGIAFLLAIHLSRPWCEWKSLVLDDPVQHVDDFRALNLTEVLAAIRKTGRQVVCCVEDEALAQLVCRRLRSSNEHDGGLAEMQYDVEKGVVLAKLSTLGPLQPGLLVRA